jgi:hypothetical protein
MHHFPIKNRLSSLPMTVSRRFVFGSSRAQSGTRGGLAKIAAVPLL